MIKQLPTIGCDPEVFLVHATTGQPIPSCGQFGGTKEKPRAIETKDTPDLGLAILEDNVTLEFNIAPSANIAEFEKRIYVAYRHVANIAEQKGMLIQLTPEMEFPPEALQAHISAMAFGCDPDFMAFKRGEERTPPDPSQLGNWRCAGQHIHLGYNKAHTKTPDWALVQYLEALVVPWYSTTHTSKVRKKHYGMPGLFRPKPYGFEWRSINYSWLSQLGGGMKCGFIRDAYRILCGLLSNDKRAREVYDLIDWPAIQKALANSVNPGKDMVVSGIRGIVEDYRAEFLAAGDEAIEACSPEKEQIVNVRQVPGPRRDQRDRINFGELDV